MMPDGGAPAGGYVVLGPNMPQLKDVDKRASQLCPCVHTLHKGTVQLLLKASHGAASQRFCPAQSPHPAAAAAHPQLSARC